MLVVHKVLLDQGEVVIVDDKVHLNQEEVVERKGLLEAAAEVEGDEVLPDCLLATQGEL